MNFLVIQLPAAPSAAGASRLPLPAAGRPAFARPELRTGRALPLMPAAPAASRSYLGQPGQPAQHRAQCRAFCRSKAGF